MIRVALVFLFYTPLGRHILQSSSCMHASNGYRGHLSLTNTIKSVESPAPTNFMIQTMHNRMWDLRQMSRCKSYSARKTPSLPVSFTLSRWLNTMLIRQLLAVRGLGIIQFSYLCICRFVEEAISRTSNAHYQLLLSERLASIALR